MSKREEDQRVIERYREAFREANPGQFPPHIKAWRPGWYYFTETYTAKKYRITEIGAMADRLEERVKELAEEGK